jgi:hypothetical protein
MAGVNSVGSAIDGVSSAGVGFAGVSSVGVGFDSDGAAFASVSSAGVGFADVASVGATSDGAGRGSAVLIGNPGRLAVCSVFWLVTLLPQSKWSPIHTAGTSFSSSYTSTK